MKRALVACILLAGCTAPAPKIITQVQTVRVHVPAALLIAPAPPAPPRVNSAGAVSAWLARLWADDLNKTDQISAIAKLNP